MSTKDIYPNLKVVNIQSDQNESRYKAIRDNGTIVPEVIRTRTGPLGKTEYAVYDKDGKKKLSRWYTDVDSAKKRLQQIEFFKNKK